jgi:hypothetical protein
MTEPNPVNSARPNTPEKKKKPSSAYRKLRRKFAETGFRAPLTWLRHRGLQSDDVFFGSFPKSGNTWARFVLFEILSGMPAGFRKTNSLMPPVGQQSKALRILPGGRRMVSTHEQYRQEYRKAIYLVRDARDIVLAEYAFLTALDIFHDDLSHFIEKSLTRGTIHGWGPWHRHVASWLESPIARTDNMLLMRFEDLRKDPIPGFARMVEFLGVPADIDKITRALENNTIQRMREKEDREPGRASIRGRFVREGAVRGWVSKLTPSQVQFIEKHAGESLARLGYPLLSQLNSEAASRPEPANHFRNLALGI